VIEKKNIEAFILAGGKSSRMGSEKGLVSWKNKPFVKHIHESIQNEVAEVSILSNTNRYDHLGLKTHEDLIKEKGPMGGIYTGLKLSAHAYNLFVSCDIPFITPALIRFLVSETGLHDIVVPVHDRKIEPLCGIYHKRCAPVISGLLKYPKTGIIDSLKHFNVRYLEISSQEFYTPRLLANINSQEDLLELKKELHES